MGFYDSLQLNGLFDRQTPFGMPQLTTAVPEKAFHMVRAAKQHDAIDEMRRAQAMQWENDERAKKNLALSQALEGPANQSGTNQMPVVMAGPPPISDYQRAQLNLERDKLSQNRDIQEARINLAEQSASKKLDEASKIELQDKLRRAQLDDQQASRMDEIAARIAGAIQQQTMRGDQAINLEDKRQTGREVIVDKNNTFRGEQGDKNRQNRIDVKNLGSTNSDKLLPTQQRVQQFMRARQFATENPNLANFIQFGSDGNSFTVKPPGGGGFFGSAGPTPEQHKQISDYIFGTSTPNGQGDTVRVISKDGKPGTIPRSQLQDALKEGFKEVK